MTLKTTQRGHTWLHLLGGLLLAASVGCGDGSSNGAPGSTCEGVDCESCEALTCDDLGAQCGTVDDGCASTLQCGECRAWETCGAEAPNVCNALCGNGVVDVDVAETCDDGNRVTESCDYGERYCQVCDRFCQEGAGNPQWCGDAFVQLGHGEECDDNNEVDWDGCDSQCQKNPCTFKEEHHSTRAEAADLTLVGSHLYLADGPNLTIFDVTQPDSPTQVANYDDGLGWDYWGLASKDGHLIVPGRGHTLAVYSLADPTNPSMVSFVDGAPSGDIHIVDDWALLATYSGFTIVDLSDLSEPVVLGSEELVSSVHFVDRKDDFAILGTSSGIHVYDISDPSDPSFVTRWDPLPDDGWTSDFHSFVIDGDRLYANGGKPRTRTLDISDPANPVELESDFEGPGSSWGPSILWNDDVVLMGRNEALFAFDVSDGAIKANLGGQVAHQIRYMVRNGDIVYVTANNDGLAGSNHYLKAIRVTCE